MFSFNTDVVHAITSGRLLAKRWSSIMYSLLLFVLISLVNGTGLNGSLMYSVGDTVLSVALKDRLCASVKYILVEMVLAGGH